MVARPTRRTFLRRSGAAAAALAVPVVPAVQLTGCGGGDEDDEQDGTATDVGAGTPGDAGLLNGMLAAEFAAIAAYTATAPLLGGTGLAAARRFLGQERAHAARLRELVRELGAEPAVALGGYDFGAPARTSDVLRLLRDVEQRTLFAYVDGVGRLEDPRLRATVASIAANEAEHEAVWLAQLGRWPVPAAFPTGVPP